MYISDEGMLGELGGGCIEKGHSGTCSSYRVSGEQSIIMVRTCALTCQGDVGCEGEGSSHLSSRISVGYNAVVSPYIILRSDIHQ